MKTTLRLGASKLRYILLNKLSISAALITLGCLFSSGTLRAQQNEREVSATSFVFEVSNVPLKVNYFSSPEADRKNNKIKRLVIVVHGATRTAFGYHRIMRIAADKAGASENTLIIAPRFIMETDLNGNKDIPTNDHIFWTNSGWKQGDASVTNSETNKRTAQMSSFEVMDSIIWKMLTSGNFPKLKQIVVAGNSAGGQYVNRYSGGNLIHDKVRKTYGIEMKYLVAAPSIYIYLTPERPIIGSPGKYLIPSDTICPAPFNNYLLGIKNFNAYMARTGEEKFKSQFGLRKVAYFVGALDNNPAAADLINYCGAKLQGRERRERAELYMEHLYRIYGKRWKLTIVSDAGHEPAKIFASEEGQKWLFR